MQKNRSLFLKLAAVLVPTIVGCTAADDSTTSAPAADPFEQSFKQLETRVPRGDLAVKTVHTDPDGTTHIRLLQSYQGIPVFEGEVITHVSPNGNVTETNALRDIRNLDITPNITKDAAIDLARLSGPADGTVQVLEAKLMVLPNGEHDSRDRLAWYVRLFSEGGDDHVAQWDTFVDAHNGKLALAYDTLETSQVTAHGHTAWTGDVDLAADLTNGVYSLIDGKGNYACDLNGTTGATCTTVTTTTTETVSPEVLDAEGNVITPAVVTGLFGAYNKTVEPRDTAAADAHFGMGKTLEYYNTTFGRLGIDVAGTRIAKSRVHYSTGYDNAFWQDSCFCMTYGDGSSFYPLTTLDVVGHELSHGVMSQEAALTYRGESGGLNESNSDIFGTLVEWYVNSPADEPDWKIGERIRISDGKPLRHMDKPSLDGRSPNCYSKTIKSLDVHYSSGPNNHFFYLLANGGTSACTGAVLTGIGLDKAARIWYKAISDYMTASTGYAGARVATINAATALYGATSPEVAAVKAAYSAIKVN